MIKIKTRPNELYFLLNHESAMKILKIFNKMGGDVKVVDQENTIITFILGDDERYYKNQSKINLTLTRDGFDFGAEKILEYFNKGAFFPAEFLEFEDLGYKNKRKRFIRTYFLSDP